MSDMTGPMASVVSDGFQISSNEGTAEEIEANLKSEPAPLDGEPEDPEEAEAKATKEAAAKLGKKGGEAAAKAHAKAEKDEETEEKPPEKPKKEAEQSEPKQKPESDEVKETGRAQARIERLARERAEERAKRVELEERLAKLEAERAKPAEDPKRPQITDYATTEEYAEAYADYKAEQKVQEALRKREEEDKAKAYAKSITDRVQTFQDRIKADPELVSKIDPEIGNLEPTWVLKPGVAPGPLNVIADELISSEAVVPLMLHLTNHPEEFEKLQALPNAREIARAIAKLEDKLTATPPQPAPKESVSRAAPPVRLLPSSVQADGNDDVDSDDTPFEKHFTVYNSRDSRIRRGR